MINSFSQYLVEEERVAYFTFGRMNPPTIGHGKLMDVLANKAGRNPYFIYLSQSQSAKKDPLRYKDKIKHVRKIFPKHARQVVINKKVINPFFALSDLYAKGFRKVVMVAGSDRVQEYDLRLNKYNGKKGSHGFYNFEGGVRIVSAGQRDADAEGAEGASGTKQRSYASDANFTKFAQGLPNNMSNNDARRLFNDVRKGMGLKEQREFKNHVQLEPVSEIRESYIRDNIFELGEQVVLNKKDGILGHIKHLGSNYLIVESKGEMWRCWLTDVSKVDPNVIPKWTDAPYQDPGEDGVIRESLTEAQKWKKGGSDGEVHTTHKGQAWRVRKAYNDNERHVGEYHIEVKKKNKHGDHDWHWHDTVRGKDHAKSRLPEGVSMYPDKPDWGTPESTKKAKKMTPGEQAEKTLTPAEKKKREEIANAMERDNPGMDMSKKMAIATATAKRVTEGEKKGLWYHIHKKRKEGRPMRKPGSKGAPTAQDFKNASEAVDHMTKARDTVAKDKAQASDMIAKEREKDKVKHDRILDRARRARMLQRNKGVKQ